MNDWPEGWSDRDRGNRYGGGSANAQPESPRVMRQVRRGPAAPPQGAGVPPQPSYVNGQGYGDYTDARQTGYDSGYNTGQVYGDGGDGGGSGGYRGGEPRPAPNWRRRIKWTAITVVTVLVVTAVGTYFWADGKLKREVDLSKVIDRPEGGDGTNYLIVGSDSREGMSAEIGRAHVWTPVT